MNACHRRCLIPIGGCLARPLRRSFLPSTYRGARKSQLLMPRTFVTIRVVMEPKNRTASDSQAFHRYSLSLLPQIMLNVRAVPATMQMTQIAQQILFKAARFMTISFQRTITHLPRD